MSERIQSRHDGAIAYIVFDNPERRNAVTLEMWGEVERLLDEIAADDEVRALVLAGAGGRSFVAGADVSKFASERASAEEVRRYNDTTARVYEKVESFPRPTIAQIDGYCIGGGVALAVCCDLRICGASSQFAIPAARLGLGYGLPGVRRLVALVGPGFTREILLTARRFAAEEAQAMGLVNRVVADGEVASAARDCALAIAANAPLTVAAIKTIVNQTLMDPADRDPALCAELVRRCFASEDYVEGRRAFLEKREPRFVGR